MPKQFPNNPKSTWLHSTPAPGRFHSRVGTSILLDRLLPAGTGTNQIQAKVQGNLIRGRAVQAISGKRVCTSSCTLYHAAECCY